MKQSLLSRYFYLKTLPPEVRYHELKRWERDVKLYLSQRSEKVTSLFVVNQN